MKRKSIILMVSLALMVAMFAGCNMLRGAEQDAENAGDTVARGIRRTGDYIARGAENVKDNLEGSTAYRRDRTLGDVNSISDSARGLYQGWNSLANSGTTNMAGRNGMGVDHLVALMGMDQNDLNLALGTGRETTTSQKGTLTQNLYGADADLNVEYDTDRSIREIKVSVDNDQLTRWQSELNSRYAMMGEPGNIMWNAKRANIRLNPVDDNRTEIVFTRPII